MSSDNYKTDKWILDIFNEWFDPCPLNDNPTTDGLSIDWKDKTFVNPPYSNPLPWVEKAIRERGKRIVMLLNVDTSTKWFSKLNEANAHFLFINGRLQYSTGKPCPKPSMLVIL